MNSIIDSAVTIQTSCQSVPSTPSWFGEVVLVVQYLRRHDILTALTKRVCFARRRFGRYEVIDFLAVLFGYALSGERTLEAFYERLHPFAPAFMALFGRERLPARSTLSRFLAALPAFACRSPTYAVSFGSIGSSSGTRRRTSRVVGSHRKSMAGLRHRWDTGGGPPTGIAEDARASFPSASLTPTVCTWLHRAQAWGSRAFPDHHNAAPTPPSGSVHSVEQVMVSHRKNYAAP